ncbi:MFS general substrate transporter [Gloeophyllum trabeum ATCC 11539]|uniref:MFS general substrate transporter n=1 Tax=Gloeophyllum trabeum (strain ATCC 11539 / FP-39264 / Madison 617) TaxID=670483 RepID=S7S470_GLOTA|nr:MFS general substrate transporter [Gloeophyllum trabeum ATCC 11539]EPQ60669.1 MFS general substrate transporter [Gloeophyllum trabeum ATCC 11539]
MIRKMDWMILPPLAFMYLCNALDRGNVGNAKTDGWDKDIGLTGNQYYVLVMVFYVPFCLFGTPISLLVKRYSAARVLPIMMFGFGAMGLCTAAAKNFSEVFALRWFLGTFESAMLPGVVFYLSTFYKRDELASRVGIFYAAASISGAFSGLIAFGVFQLKNSKYHGWQYLFWIEGAGTILFSVFAFFWLPRSPATTRFFTARERLIAKARILSDSSTAIDERLSFRDAFRPFTDWRYGVWALISLSLGVPLASVNNFLPQIVQSLGYSTVKTNLYTVAPNIAGTVVLLIMTFSSDYFRERSIHICVPLAIGLVGFIILGTIDVLAHRNVAYFACFLLCMGAPAPSVLTSSWYSNNTTNESGRAVVAAVMVGIANSSGLISANVFRAQDAPKYVPALITSACFGGICIVLVASLGIYMRLENRRRDKEQGLKLTSAQVDTEVLGQGPASPLFRYVY